MTFSPKWPNPFATVADWAGWSILLLALSSAPLSAQSSYLNLSFETSSNSVPAVWSFGSSYYTYTVDTSTAVDGAQSLRIDWLTGPPGQFGDTYVGVPAAPAIGKTFHLSGAIRTQGVNGYASLFVQIVDAQFNTVAFTDLEPLAPAGTTPWQRYDVSVGVPAGAATVYFGTVFTGTGTAWFDDLRTDVNGVNLYYPDPASAQTQWIRANAIPFTSLDPNADLTELEPLKKVIGNAHIVGLGEGTHGTSEFFRMKSRLVSFLAQEMGFTVFAIEANMPEAYRVNDYVLTGRGDPKELLRGMYFWTWNTQEVLDMVQWMRQFNASGKGQIQFLGFDMQYPDVALDYVARFVRQAEPGLLPTVNSCYGLVGSTDLAKAQAAQADAQSILDELQANRAKYLQQMSATEVDWAIQNARILQQQTQLNLLPQNSAAANALRDAAMAANVEWIAAQAPPGARIVLWAHNLHIQKEPGAMGGALAQYFGQDYVALGQAFHSGKYRAGGGAGVYDAYNSFPGSAEYFFHQTGTPQQILDLRLSNANDPASGWLPGVLEFRNIGAAEVDGIAEFSSTSRLVQDYDGLIFFDQTTASAELPFTTMDLSVFAPTAAPSGTLGVPYVPASAPSSGTPSPLPAGTVGAPYTQTLMAGGGAWPYRNWTLAGGALPTGFTLTSDGVLSGTPTAAGSFTFTVQTTDANNQTAQGQLTLTINLPILPGLRFVPATPCRVVDTRNPSGAFGGPTLAAGGTRSFSIPQSACSIPATAQAYSLNVTVVPYGVLPFLSLWPAGQSQPVVSTLNSWEGAVVANAAIVPAGTNGGVSVYAAGAADVILDINGYFDSSTGPSSYLFYPAAPCRIADTRGSAGPFGGPSIAGEQSRDFAIPLSACGIPFGAGAYALNVTVVPDPVVDYLGFLTIWPAGQAQPNVSTLNSWAGNVVANAALVPAGANGSVSVFASNPTDVILDANGYFGAAGGRGALSFYPVTPCRVADTRNPDGPFGGPILDATGPRSFAIPAGDCGIPSTAAAYSLNITVVPDGPLYYLTALPTGPAQPYVSTLNSWDGTVVANAAIVPAGTNGAVSIYVAGRTHAILDINGYFAP